MKTVFMGTPDFAVPPLHALIEAGYEVAAVVTQPDKPKGRGKTLLPTPVKEEALMHEIPVYQPQKVRNNQEFLETLKEINPDIIIVAAFGQIIPKEVQLQSSRQSLMERRNLVLRSCRWERDLTQEI